VLEADPHSRLAYTWHTFSREWGVLNNFSDEMVMKFASERRSKVSFTIEKTDGVVRLTMVHDGFEPGSAVLEAVSSGWPPLLSSLKTYLETGSALDFK
ncbi:MAG: SRPBCC domain-containing protein, partial [Acidimicrobiales bacterium]